MPFDSKVAGRTPLVPHNRRSIQIPSIPDDLVNIENLWTLPMSRFHGKNFEENFDQRKRTSSFDPVRANEHQAKFLAAHTLSGTTAPEWFTVAMDKYTHDTTQQIAQLREDIRAQVKHIERLAVLSHNMLCGDGRNTPFEVLPFLDGTSPTESPHNLPPLRNIENVLTLTGPESSMYYAGYYFDCIPQVAAKRKVAIQKAIGYRIG